MAKKHTQYKLEESYRLRVKGGEGMDGYIFNDAKHAIEWLSQDFVLVYKDNYGLEKIQYSRRSCCGTKFVTKVLRKRMSYKQAMIHLALVLGDIKHGVQTKSRKTASKRSSAISDRRSKSVSSD